MSKKHKHEEHEEHADETWLIPYADLLTLLLALFIVLYAMSSVDAKKFEDLSKAFNIAFNSGSGVLDQSAVVTNANRMNEEDRTKRNSDGKQTMSERQRQQEVQTLRQKEQQEFERLKRQLDQYIENNGLTTKLGTKLNQSQLMITISNNALFDSGSAAIKEESAKLATAIGIMLKAYPGYEIKVAGHTDNRPIHTVEFPSNYELSAKRAINFMTILIAAGQLDPKLVSPTGYGEFRPIATNDTAAGRARNRRVEVSIIRKYTDAAATQTLTVAAER
ncbi:MAG TPA: flagellar motor protein MotB [Paenibacillus sp.]|uniref:flagellar motor protein MotB n=1 Tax=Paenibacillus sp. TaxID=58172 RepID=UPI0028D157A1|nr:flagellar motor protein MotB [Paenibacillus sp.]HUC94169.1 flagellar motor protein MotB [Paenibacillus sp.]